MKILVTGSEGFIGRHAVNTLLNLNHEVLTFDTKTGQAMPSLSDVDRVIHMGAISSTTETNVEAVMTYNYDFSCELLDECVSRGIPFQYSSSASIYGKGTSFNEDAPVQPLSPYAWSKYMFERYAAVSRLNQPSNKGCIIQGFRYFNVFGSGEDHKGNQSSPYSKFRRQALESGVIKVFAGSSQFKRDFVPVQTIVNTHIKFFNIPESGIWNIGTGTAKSFMDVAEEVALETDSYIKIIPFPNELYSSYQSYTCADITKLNESIHKWGV